MMVILVLIMAMMTQVGVVVQYSSSQLTDFTGLLYQDSLSHRHLNLRSDLVDLADFPHLDILVDLADIADLADFADLHHDNCERQ